jgi:SpoVK/Ycf46/Vps4 family AAA+-type ATPase
LAERDAILLYGPPGVGKTWTVTVAWSILQRQYNNGKERIVFIASEGSAIEGALVGSGPKTLREIRSLAKKAVSENKLPVTFINEAGALLRSREIQGQMLDGGSSLSTHEQFLSMLSGPEEVPGILIVDLNMEKMLDEATRQRFTCIAYPHIDREVLVDHMFKTAYRKEQELFEGSWEELRRALTASLDTVVGTVLVGSKTSPVKVANLTSGRLYEKVIHEALGLVDLTIYDARSQGIEPLYARLTGPVLYHTLTHRAWSLFKCWNDGEARERLVPELVRPEKARSISKPT